ncbi:E3 ubiquitin-protein ligase PUB23-like [Primulina eburnea]|uniref:E3 ubiquitin-protein ligase PUB23-like n=1 Tax=Primulina eburnea TaxID=1245227 RepID=UPI003C6CBAEE
MDIPEDFRCPISTELMKDPVTISTGVSYERKNIEKWFYVYKKTTCPATMQMVEVFDVTPNHNLKNLICAWCISKGYQRPGFIGSVSSKHDELVSILGTIDSTPFKVSCLRKLGDILEMSDEFKEDFKASGGVEALVKIITQILAESLDFAAFRACEEALGVLNQVPFSEEDERVLHILMRPECMKSLAIMLQRGSSEARFCTISVLQKISRSDYQWNVHLAEENGVDFFKTLLDILSDENCTKASSCSLQVLVEILDSSKKARLKSIEAGAICTLVELLPDSNRWKCEKIMYLMKLMCECAEGRLALVEHGMGIAAVSKKMMNVSNLVTKIGVKIFWLILNYHASERVLEEILVCGAVGRLVSLLQMDGGVGGPTTERVVKILQLHGGRWRRYPCFPIEFKKLHWC